MPIHFSRRNATSSKYIGLVNGTNNAFISFWLQKVEIKRQSRIITFVFNETGIDSIYVSQRPFGYLLFFESHKLHSLKYHNSTDMNAISHLLLNGNITRILGDLDPSTWCVKDQWESYSNAGVKDRGKCSIDYMVFLLMVIGMLCSLSMIVGSIFLAEELKN